MKSGETSDSDLISQADRSIVVLPFADMSQTKDQQYLSDGLAEELLNLLARVPQLRVISRWLRSLRKFGRAPEQLAAIHSM